MFSKKDPIRVIMSPEITNLALADAWSQFVSQYDCLRAQAEGGWNKTQFIGVLNCFFVPPPRAVRTIPPRLWKVGTAAG